MKNIALVKRPSKSFIGPMPLVEPIQVLDVKKLRSNKVVQVKPVQAKPSKELMVIKPLTIDELKAKIDDLEAKLKDARFEMTRLYGSAGGYKPPMNAGVGAFIKSKIKEGLRNVDILKLVEAEYSNNNTTYACVAWYRNDMKKKGLI